MVSGSRPHACSSARNIPEMPVPLSSALSSAESVTSNVADTLT
ncbi:Uncharacterised protein [Mycobacterium tuberculosis]|nr:Uncharacterised protein [Mycobacterium tuberculosis]